MYIRKGVFMELNTHFTSCCRKLNASFNDSQLSFKKILSGKKSKSQTGTVCKFSFDNFNLFIYYIEKGKTAYAQQTLWLAMTVDNVKTDRTPLDLLFQVMLDLGVELSAKIEEHTVNSKTYYTVNGNDIIACFDDDIDNEVITAIAKQNPLYAVFKDKSFATDSVGINNEQLFKTYSPSTVVKVL